MFLFVGIPLKLIIVLFEISKFLIISLAAESHLTALSILEAIL